MRRLLKWVFLAGSVVGPFSPIGGGAAPMSDQEREFFESRIRPILAQECYECHSEATKAKGGLLLDSRDGWKKGGESGQVIVEGNPEESLLFRSISHVIPDLKMPKAGVALDENILDDFRSWIAAGAPDPRDRAPSTEEIGEDTSWKAISDRRAQWWSFQPLKRPEVPIVPETIHPVDCFIRDRLARAGLVAADRAGPEILLRRLSFNLIGLPPTLAEQEKFLESWKIDPDKATIETVDRLLADPGFGEKWARHWMDWTRYADTHGSEGDPAIPHAYQYRDYLIRALNDDVPFDQMLLEHFAGDLLSEPRINAELQLNESALGLWHLRMVFHGFAPTDALEERVRFTDDQINVATKAFLGLTVSCARCHDHKFDAISQEDYYALFGIFSASLPATIAVDAPGVLDRNQDEMSVLKPRIRKEFARFWEDTLTNDADSWEQKLASVAKKFPLLSRFGSGEGAGTGGGIGAWWSEECRKLDGRLGNDDDRVIRRWDLSDPGHMLSWSRYGEGLTETTPSHAGEFVINPAESWSGTVVKNILPDGVYSHLLSTRHRGVLASAPFDLIEKNDLYLLVAGEGSSVRYVVQHYPRSGTVYPVTNLEQGNWRWIKHDLSYWEGDSLHLELATAGDAPILVKPNERSWFGIRDAVLIKTGSEAPSESGNEAFAALRGYAGTETPGDFVDLSELVRGTLKQILRDWGSGDDRFDNASALFLDEALAAGLLPNHLNSLPDTLSDLIREYQALEAAVPRPTRAPGVFERKGIDQAVFVRGDHKQPGELVPRRFLEVLDSTPYSTEGSGRLEFARDLVDEKNPFTARVVVNRICYQLFGEGIVSSVDNFGRLGEKPSHPELLDFLADRFRNEQGWSFKSLIRDLVLSETWRQAGGLSMEAKEQDPGNRLLSSFPLRRLEAEAIRDSLLSVSGQLVRELYGPPVGGGGARRSIYLEVERNHLEPLLTTFDFPVPASTVGKRDATNVPAQSLTLLNDQFVAEQAGNLAAALKGELPDGYSDEQGIAWLFRTTLNRQPTENELAGATSFLAALEGEQRVQSERLDLLFDQIKKNHAELEALLEPVRARLEGEQVEKFAKESGQASPGFSPEPLARWDFAAGTSDLIGGVSLTMEGSARIENGTLVLDGDGFARSRPLDLDLSEKTFVVVAELATLDQAGGGVMTVQDLKGSNFDSLVFAERRGRQWLAGSNQHLRTLDLNGHDEVTVMPEKLHLALTWERDGTISCYRNGTVWGAPFRKADLHPFESGKTVVLFGLRHGTSIQGNRTFRGRIHQARLFGSSLSRKEIEADFVGAPAPIARQSIVEALDPGQRGMVTALEQEIVSLESERTALDPMGTPIPAEQRKWADLAHALFNLKEFIYLR